MDPDIIIGYNICNFDLPYLIRVMSFFLLILLVKGIIFRVASFLCSSLFKQWLQNNEMRAKDLLGKPNGRLVNVVTKNVISSLLIGVRDEEFKKSIGRSKGKHYLITCGLAVKLMVVL